METPTMIFLASPYSHENARVRLFRYQCALEFTTKYIAAGQQMFSPIVYGHTIHMADPTINFDAKTWENINNTVFQSCRELYVLQLPDWEQSKGVHNEIILAHKYDMKISYMRMRDAYDL